MHSLHWQILNIFDQDEEIWSLQLSGSSPFSRTETPGTFLQPKPSGWEMKCCPMQGAWKATALACSRRVTLGPGMVSAMSPSLAVEEQLLLHGVTCPGCKKPGQQMASANWESFCPAPFWSTGRGRSLLQRVLWWGHIHFLTSGRTRISFLRYFGHRNLLVSGTLLVYLFTLTLGNYI